MMRIGFDATVLQGPTRHTGAGRCAEGLLSAMGPRIADQGEVVAFAWEDAGEPFPSPPGVRWEPVPRLPLGRWSALATSLAVLPRAVAASGVELFHTPTVHTRPSLPPVPSGLACPLVVTLHDVIPLTQYAATNRMPLRMRRFYRWNLRRALRADRLVTVSDHSRREIASRTGTSTDRIDVVYNGVDLPGGATGGTLPGRPVLWSRPFALYVGSSEPRKNLPRLVEAFAIAVSRGLDCDLVLVTDPASGHAPRLRELIERSGVRARVHLRSGLPARELEALYRAATFLAFPSLSEGFGLPPVEAMLVGTPVLASRLGALPEVLGEAARYVDAFDTTAIAEGMLELAQNAGLRTRLRTAGCDVARRYTWQRAAEQTLAVYQDVLRRARGEAP